MKIVHLDRGRQMRGGQIQAMRLMQGLRDRGHDVALLARTNSPILNAALKERLRAEVLTIPAIRRLTRNANLVHAHDARSHLFAALFSRAPLVVSRRVVFPINTSPWSRWKYRRATAFAAVSHAVASELNRAGVAEARTRVIYDGVPLLPQSWDPHGPVVIPQWKQSHIAIEAVRQAHGSPVLSQNLQDDLPGASLFVYISDSEGLGSAALLAMSAGIPVIASDVGGLKEFVLDGKTGLLVNNEVNAIARAIQKLRESPDEAAAMAVRARHMVETRFSIDRMIAETLDLYDGIIRAT